MKRTWMRSTAAATLLAAALAVAAPARALGWPEWAPGSGLAHAAWSWLAELWAEKAGGCIDPDGGSTPCPSLRITRPPETPAPAWQKEGGCIDPMGGSTLCRPQSNAGSGADPDH